jgi:hypothetical protein
VSSIKGCAFLYNFDFLKFRDRAEETMRPVNIFHCRGLVWKFRFGGEIRLYVNGTLKAAVATSNNKVDSYPLSSPLIITSHDDLCVEVTDIQPRWFHWFRPNMAQVSLEGQVMFCDEEHAK